MMTIMDEPPRGERHTLTSILREPEPERTNVPCWTCGNPGQLRRYATTSQFYCDECAAAHRRLWEREGRA
jgi:hypothetical protein